MKVKTFTPAKGKIFVTEMDEGDKKTAGGIILRDDLGTETGIRPRWGRVAIVAPDIDYVVPGEWVLVEHGRWTQRIPLEVEGEEPINIWMIDPEAIMIVSDTNHALTRLAAGI